MEKGKRTREKKEMERNKRKEAKSCTELMKKEMNDEEGGKKVKRREGLFVNSNAFRLPVRSLDSPCLKTKRIFFCGFCLSFKHKHKTKRFLFQTSFRLRLV